MLNKCHEREKKLECSRIENIRFDVDYIAIESAIL